MTEKRIVFCYLPVRILWTGILAVLVGMLLSLQGGDKETNVELTEIAAGKVVVIDAGHGGEDAGAVGREGVTEKDLSLDLARRLQKKLNRVGIYAYLTREGDRGITNAGGKQGQRSLLQELERRISVARKSKADVLVSFHAGSFPECLWYGAQVLCGVGAEDAGPAGEIQQKLSEQLGPKRRKVKAANYYILKQAGIPAAVIEVGYLSNPWEERLLAEAGYRMKIVRAAYEGILAYFVRLSRNPRGANQHAPNPRYPSRNESGIPPARRENEVFLHYLGAASPEWRLVLEKRKVAQFDRMNVEDQARAIWRELVKGPDDESILKRLWPAQMGDARIRILGCAVSVDLPEDAMRYFVGAGYVEELTVYSLVNSLTELPGIHTVQILINGKKGGTIGGHIFFTGPFSRRPDLCS